mmetsp:Transcript_81252/g.217201  ORF Transcript_81252/g.217201 Transcript_81252/m.217201 type:complete len:240 (+) Transcript_81252:813-1532(+)
MGTSSNFVLDLPRPGNSPLPALRPPALFLYHFDFCRFLQHRCSPDQRRRCDDTAVKRVELLGGRQEHRNRKLGCHAEPNSRQRALHCQRLTVTGIESTPRRRATRCQLKQGHRHAGHHLICSRAGNLELRRIQDIHLNLPELLKCDAVPYQTRQQSSQGHRKVLENAKFDTDPKGCQKQPLKTRARYGMSGGAAISIKKKDSAMKQLVRNPWASRHALHCVLKPPIHLLSVGQIHTCKA